VRWKTGNVSLRSCYSTFHGRRVEFDMSLLRKVLLSFSVRVSGFFVRQKYPCCVYPRKTNSKSHLDRINAVGLLLQNELRLLGSELSRNMLRLRKVCLDYSLQSKRESNTNFKYSLLHKKKKTNLHFFLIIWTNLSSANQALRSLAWARSWRSFKVQFLLIRIRILSWIFWLYEPNRAPVKNALLKHYCLFNSWNIIFFTQCNKTNYQ